MEIQIGQDIRKYKTKDIGNFSFKETAYLAVGALGGFACYKFLNSMELAVFPLGIACILGFFKPYGMSFIQFVKTVIKENMTTQCYVNETDFEYDEKDVLEFYPNIVIPTDWNVIQTNTTVKINKKDKAKIIK